MGDATTSTCCGGARQLSVELVEPSAALDRLPGVLAVTVEAGGLRQRLAFSPSQTTAASLMPKWCAGWWCAT